MRNACISRVFWRQQFKHVHYTRAGVICLNRFIMLFIWFKSLHLTWTIVCKKPFQKWVSWSKDTRLRRWNVHFSRMTSISIGQKWWSSVRVNHFWRPHHLRKKIIYMERGDLGLLNGVSLSNNRETKRKIMRIYFWQLKIRFHEIFSRLEEWALNIQL